MGGFLGKQKHYSSAASVSELQEKILRYIVSDDPELDGWGSSDVLKACQKFGFTSLEHFLQDVPPHILKQYDVDGIKNEQHISGVGSRFVLRSDTGIRGRCTEIKIRVTSDTPGYATFIEMRLDQPKNGRVEPPLLMVYPVEDLLLEKQYLRGLLKSCITEKEECSAKPIFTSSKFNESILKSEPVTQVKAKTILNPPSSSSPSPSKRKKQNSLKKDEQPTFKTEPVADTRKETNSPKPKSHQHEIHDPSSNIHPKLYSVVASQPQPPINSVFQTAKSSKKLKKFQNSLIHKTAPPPWAGKQRGIHGTNNSCYMDSLLFSLFYNTTQFNDVFLTKKEKDSEDAQELRRILVENVVTPLTTQFYCPPSSLGGLRRFLSKFDDRFQGAMMDIEELVYQMLEEILDEPHFLQYNNGTKDYIHQILTDAEADNVNSTDGGQGLNVKDVQSCLENSFKLWGGLKLLHCPNPGFFIQFPRSDGDLIQYDGILPNPTLNLVALYDSDQHSCSMCHGGSGEWECRNCKNSETHNECVAYCTKCMNSNQEASLACGHSVSTLQNRNILQLQSIICINSAHYTAIVKSFESSNRQLNQWMYFDSMAGPDPEVILLNDFEAKLRQTETFITTGTYSNRFNNNSSHNKWVSKAMRDSHICIYLPTPWHQRDPEHA